MIRPIPAVLVTPLQYPPPLPSTMTVHAVIEQLFSAYDVIDQCNIDRAQVRAIAPPP